MKEHEGAFRALIQISKTETYAVRIRRPPTIRPDRLRGPVP
jgi:hypothetical protein